VYGPDENAIRFRAFLVFVAPFSPVIFPSLKGGKIMKKNKFYIRLYKMLLFLAFISLFRCSNPTETINDPSFGFYYLSDSTITYDRAQEENISQLELQNEPFINAADLNLVTAFYDNNGKIPFYHFEIADSNSLALSDSIKPFVFIINDQKFLAEYWPTFTANVPKSILFYRAFGNIFEFFNNNPELSNQLIIKTFKELGVNVKSIDLE
jgi:hypothetical protein